MKSIDELKCYMEKNGLPGHFAALSPFAKNAIRIALSPCADSEIPVGACKMGGLPDLPAGVDWFCRPSTGAPLSFLAQINLAEVQPYDTENKLPERGVLYFFYDCTAEGMPWGFDPEDADGWKVYFYDGDSACLKRQSAPDALEEDLLFAAAKLTFEQQIELPNYDSNLCEEIDLPEEENDAYDEWLDAQDDTPINKLLGHSDNIQSGMEMECEVVTSGISCGSPEGYEQAYEQGLDKKAARWNLLLQLDSNEELGMMWGDVGRLYFWIPEEDLAARRFDNCWMILQCT